MKPATHQCICAQFLVLFLAVTPLAASAATDDLGRLFFSPERRASLDRQRQLNIQEVRSLEGATISLDGVVARSSGKNTVWVNHKATTEKNSETSGLRSEVKRDKPGSVLLTPGDDSPTALKVGEVINRATGDRNDRLGGGTIRPGKTERQ